jgi:hypothetical protein
MTLTRANILQVKLIKQSGMKPSEWIEKYAKRFRQIANLGIKDLKLVKKYLYSEKLDLKKIKS